MGYEQWRARLPFTDEQILEALQQLKVSCENAGSSYLVYRTERTIQHFSKTRRLSGKIYALALPWLVTTCFCGKKALYRMGSQGRCKKHRLVTTIGREVYQARLNGASAHISLTREEFMSRLDKARNKNARRSVMIRRLK